jgi:DNA-binding LacI/PurR family transcriptional regulator
VPHDFLLPGVRAALDSAGIAVPGGFGLVVWGEPADADEEYPSHIAWSKEAMGREAVRRLRFRVSRPEAPPATVTIPAELVECGTGGRGREQGELA